MDTLNSTMALAQTRRRTPFASVRTSASFGECCASRVSNLLHCLYRKDIADKLEKSFYTA